MISVSIVSHGHGAMVDALVDQLRECPEVTRVILTRNVPETNSHVAGDGFVDIVENKSPKGFGANHNAAFRRCSGTFYCVLNPDIRLKGNPFPELRRCLEAHGAAVSAPLILAPDGTVEDSARRFPTVTSLLLKALGMTDGRYAIAAGQAPLFPDWVGGMFMLFRSEDFAGLNGFDERYFLYYEDVDICSRMWKAGSRVVVCPTVCAIHDARRESHRSLRHLRWHLASMARYLLR